MLWKYPKQSWVLWTLFFIFNVVLKHFFTACLSMMKRYTLHTDWLKRKVIFISFIHFQKCWYFVWTLFYSKRPFPNTRPLTTRSTFFIEIFALDLNNPSVCCSLMFWPYTSCTPLMYGNFVTQFNCLLLIQVRYTVHVVIIPEKIFYFLFVSDFIIDGIDYNDLWSLDIVVCKMKSCDLNAHISIRKVINVRKFM